MATTGRTPTAAAKPRTATAPKTKKPTVHFSIAQASAEVDEEIAEEYVEPYTVEARDGTVVVFEDPRNLDVFVAASLDMRDPYTTFRTLVPDTEQYNALVEGGFKSGVANKLMAGYKEHYKGLVVDLGN